ncbi:MAG: radical SAM family heme chaperone HemW [Oscillospiraceae bacterium]
MAKRLGIYIHIPFCASKCSYCDFYSLAGCEHLMPEYHKALLAHLDESAKSIKNYEVDSIYFGGGTPSFYGADRIIEIFNALKLNGNVRLDAEVTIEVNPDSISLNALKLLREEGVNRLSIGVQASDNNLLKLIGRRHNFQQAQTAVANARKAGFDNVSLDLIYGLPSQMKSDWAQTLAKVIELHPEHLSCYGLKLEPGTKMYEDYYGSPILPDDDEQADMYCYAAELLERYGYKQYEISNFCAPGYESRHNMKYWTLEDYMGFGPGAHSCVGNLRYSYVRDLKQYIAGVLPRGEHRGRIRDHRAARARGRVHHARHAHRARHIRARLPHPLPVQLEAHRPDASGLRGEGLGGKDRRPLALHRAWLPHIQHAYRHPARGSGRRQD